jgi:hypothetical protein
VVSGFSILRSPWSHEIQGDRRSVRADYSCLVAKWLPELTAGASGKRLRRLFGLNLDW